MAGPQALHCISCDAGCTRATPSHSHQLCHRYLDDPIEVLLLHENGTSEHALVGPDLRASHRVQLLIPGNTFYTARVVGQWRWFLGASTEWSRVEKVDVELGDVDALAAKYPDVADDL